MKWYPPVQITRQTVLKGFPSSSCGSPLGPEVIQARHEAEEAHKTRIEPLDPDRVQTVMHGHGQPIGRDHKLIPPLPLERLLLLSAPGRALLLDLGLAPETQKVRSHTDQPGPTTPRDPLVDAAALFDQRHGHDALAREVVDVLEQLERDVARALEQGDAAQGRVHFGRGLARRKTLEPDVQRDQARESQRRACVGEERAQRCEEG